MNLPYALSTLPNISTHKMSIILCFYCLFGTLIHGPSNISKMFINNLPIHILAMPVSLRYRHEDSFHMFLVHKIPERIQNEV